jgi:hypothetical protein
MVGTYLNNCSFYSVHGVGHVGDLPEQLLLLLCTWCRSCWGTTLNSCSSYSAHGADHVGDLPEQLFLLLCTWCRSCWGPTWTAAPPTLYMVQIMLGTYLNSCSSYSVHGVGYGEDLPEQLLLLLCTWCRSCWGPT